jgi:transcription initiation factor IIE alpha subunit
MLITPIENAETIINIVMEILYKIGRYGLVNSVKHSNDKKYWIVIITMVDDKKLEMHIDSKTMALLNIKKPKKDESNESNLTT